MPSELAYQIADDIIKELFTNGAGKTASRLVLELENGRNGGGWAKFAARDYIIDIIDRHLASREAHAQQTCPKCGANLQSGTTPKDGKTHCPQCRASW